MVAGRASVATASCHLETAGEAHLACSAWAAAAAELQERLRRFVDELRRTVVVAMAMDLRW